MRTCTHGHTHTRARRHTRTHIHQQVQRAIDSVRLVHRLQRAPIEFLFVEGFDVDHGSIGMCVRVCICVCGWVGGWVGGCACARVCVYVCGRACGWMGGCQFPCKGTSMSIGRCHARKRMHIHIYRLHNVYGMYARIRAHTHKHKHTHTHNTHNTHTHTHTHTHNTHTRAHIHTLTHAPLAGLPKRLFLAIVPPQPRHITRFDSRAGVELDPVSQEHAEALCTVVNALHVGTYSRQPDWMFVASTMKYELYIYFTYFIYCVCIASFICIVCVPRAPTEMAPHPLATEL